MRKRIVLITSNCILFNTRQNIPHRTNQYFLTYFQRNVYFFINKIIFHPYSFASTNIFRLTNVFISVKRQRFVYGVRTTNRTFLRCAIFRITVIREGNSARARDGRIIHKQQQYVDRLIFFFSSLRRETRRARFVAEATRLYKTLLCDTAKIYMFIYVYASANISVSQ